MTAPGAHMADGLRGVMRLVEPMAKHTVWGIGGPAARYYQPADACDLVEFLLRIPDEEAVLWLGLGSNVLIRDGGFSGTVIATAKALASLELVSERVVRCEAGVACPKLAKFCARNGLGGGEFFAGIPGSLGGALAMNAGAFGGSTWDVVAGVECVGRDARRRLRSRDEFRYGYRSLQMPAPEWFLSATLEFEVCAVEEVEARIRDLLQKRGATQPMGTRSCGSVFKNPAHDHAARLIDTAGLKGTRIGDAIVSPKHANFILNLGNASADDVEALMNLVAETVERKHSVHLEPEVRIVGDAVGSKV